MAFSKGPRGKYAWTATVYLMAALLCGIGTMALYELLRRIPVVKYLVLGE